MLICAIIFHINPQTNKISEDDHVDKEKMGDNSGRYSHKNEIIQTRG